MGVSLLQGEDFENNIMSFDVPCDDFDTPNTFLNAEGNGRIGAIEGVPTLSLSEAQKLMK